MNCLLCGKEITNDCGYCVNCDTGYIINDDYEVTNEEEDEKHILEILVAYGY